MIGIYAEKTIFGRKDSWLELKYLRINALPKGFKCMGSLSCDGSSLTELPEDLIVLGNLYIGECDITSLPRGLAVGGDLILLNSAVLALPDDIGIGGDIVAIRADNTPTYKPNTVAKNWICDRDGNIIIYTNVEECATSLNPLQHRRAVNMLFYDGGALGKCAISLNAPDATIYSCVDYESGCAIINRDKLKKSIYFQKYYNYDVDQKRFVKELITIFKEITDACDLGIDEFFSYNKDLLLTNKYSIRETSEMLSNILDKNEGWHHYINLFNEYFFHRELFQGL